VSNNKVIEHALKPYPVSNAELRATQAGDTMDTAFCGNWFPKGESIDNRETRDFREIAYFQRVAPEVP
jgi:hypothetical protein